MGKILSKALPIIAAVATTAAGFPEFAPVAAGATQGGETLAHGGSIGQALKSGAFTGAGSFLGGAIGNSLGAGAGNVGQALDSSFGGSSIGNFVVNSISPELANVGVGSAIGGTIGGSIGSDLGAPKPKTPTIPGFTPSQAPAAQAPGSLSNLSGLTPLQQATSLASQGSYGGGLGPDEQAYFTNLENRRLYDDKGQQQSLSALTPIESSYLQKLGISGSTPDQSASTTSTPSANLPATGMDSTSLLEALSKWKKPA